MYVCVHVCMYVYYGLSHRHALARAHARTHTHTHTHARTNTHVHAITDKELSTMLPMILEVAQEIVFSR